MNIFKYSLLLLLAGFSLVGSTPIGVVQALVEGVVGSPGFHKTVEVKFDPDVAKRRNPEFEAINGHHSVHLIEKLGLGMDGFQAQRLQQQRERDAPLFSNNYREFYA